MTVTQHAYLSRSNDDPSTHLINDIADPLTRSLTTLELSDALMLDPTRHPLASASSRGRNPKLSYPRHPEFFLCTYAGPCHAPARLRQQPR